MGGRRATASSSGRKRPVQVRLDQMLKPRRSTRLRSTNEKDEGGSKVFENETVTSEQHLLEIEESLTSTIALASSSVGDSSKKAKSQRGSNKNKEKVVTKEEVPLPKELQIELLIKFDLNPMYGPCRGISRRERYLRSLKYHILPGPDEKIPKILNENSEDYVFNKCIWDQNELLRARN